MTSGIVAVDFFCGAGGLTRGLLDAGISVRLGVDSDEDCARTYQANNQGARFLHADIRRARLCEIASHVEGIPPDRLLFAACAPCQPFSKQRGADKASSDRTLLGAFSNFVEAFRPGQVLLENVPGLAKRAGYNTYRRLLKTLAQLGYGWDAGVVDAKWYGVPQTRRRFVLIAMLGVGPSLPPRTHGPGGVPYKTVRDAIAHYPLLRAGEAHPVVPNHRASALSDANLERLRSTPRDGGDRRSWPPRLQLPCHRSGYCGHTDVYGRMWWDRPAPALTSRFDSVSNGRYGHPEQDRAISLREAASLQTFPDCYVFYGDSKRSIALQIGNAVPVELARVLGRRIVEVRRQA